MAQILMQPTTRTERRLLNAARRGEGATTDGLPDWERTIRAAFVRDIAVRPNEYGVHAKGIMLDAPEDFRATVTGQLDLDEAVVGRPLGLEGCDFDSPVVLSDARVGNLFLSRSTLPGLRAYRLKATGALFLRGSTVTNTVDLMGAEIGGDFDCSGATLNTPTGNALDADHMTVKGSAFLRNGFSAEGEVRLLGATIGGNLDCTGATLEAPDGDALSADGMTVTGSVFLDGTFSAEGAVRLLDTEIGGILGCVGATLKTPKGNALYADRLTIKGSVFLSDGFSAEGTVRFMGAEIRGDLYCIGATLKAPDRLALNAERITIRGGLGVFSMPCPPEGSLELSWGRIGTLALDRTAWPAAGEFAISGLTYTHFHMRDQSDPVDWLALQDQSRFTPQPYEQLARVLRAEGREDEAKRVGMAKQKTRLAHGHLPGWRRAGVWFLGKTIGYGYETWRAFLMMLAMVILGAFLFDRAMALGIMVPAKERVLMDDRYKDPRIVREWLPAYPAFQPIAYSIDTFVPILNLHQESYWLPDGAKEPFGWIYRAYLWLHIIVGWALTTVAVAGLTGLVKKD